LRIKPDGLSGGPPIRRRQRITLPGPLPWRPGSLAAGVPEAWPPEAWEPGRRPPGGWGAQRLPAAHQAPGPWQARLTGDSPAGARSPVRRPAAAPGGHHPAGRCQREPPRLVRHADSC